MLKQTLNRNQRTKGFKLKQGFKILILIALGIWLLYQLKHSNGEKKAYEESSSKIFEMLKAGHEIKKLGRKAFEPWIKKPYELIDDTEDSKPERVRGQSTGRDDDDVVGHDRHRVEEEEPEEIEDLIDGEDKEEEEEENEDEDGDDMRKEIEDVNLLEDQGHNEGEKRTQATTENHYKENGASRVAMRGTQSIGTQDEVENLESSRTEKQQKVVEVDNVTI